MRAVLTARPAARSAALLAAALIAVPLFGAPAEAQVARNPSVAAFDPSFREWVSLHQISAASAAIMKDGHLVSTFGAGGMTAATPARIASLSKAITAVCIAQLVDSGRLSFTAPLSSVLPRTFATLGRPVDPRFRTITIEQLLTHRSGLPRETAGGAPARDLTGSFINILATPLDSDPGTTMEYSNIGYLILGVVIEAVTGSTYERYCRTAALAPMQASGTIDPQLRQRASSGGWRVSAIDYARFIQVFEPGSAGLGPLGRQWQDGLSGRRYGLGIFISRTPQGIVLNHSGRLIRERSGSYVIKFPNGWTAVTTFVGDPRGHIADLRRRLETAVASL